MKNKAAIPGEGGADALDAELTAMTRLHDLSTRLWRRGEIPHLLQEILDAVTELQGAALGCVQLYDPATETLKLVAQRGLSREFLERFAEVKDQGTICSRALRSGERVLVLDVLAHPEYHAYHALAVADQFRGVQSTPMFSRNNEPLGVLSTLFREPRVPPWRELRITDLYARQGAEMIERKRADEALRASEERFHRYFDLGLIGMAITSIATGFTEINDEVCRILGYPREELLRKTWPEMTHPEDLPADVAQFERVLAGEIDGYSLEKRYFRKDGSIVHCIMSAKGVRGADGAVDYFVGLIQDITERKHAEEAAKRTQSELARASRQTAMGELAASIAHELNQPLGAIVNNGNACLRMLEASDAAREAVLDMVKEANRASALITHIRALTKPVRLDRTRVAVRDLVAEVLELARRELDEGRVAVHTHLAPELPNLSVDRVQLHQLLLNLVMNAIDAMSTVDEAERVLTIDARSETLEGAAAVLLSVKDAGIGFRTEESKRLFQPFHTTKASGMGMGLRIVRSIVEAHGGRMWATSSPGAGATFHCLIPIES